jgi:hypothetical protein
MLSGFLHGPAASLGMVVYVGPLYRLGGLFKVGQTRHCELTEDALVCYLTKGNADLVVQRARI